MNSGMLYKILVTGSASVDWDRHGWYSLVGSVTVCEHLRIVRTDRKSAKEVADVGFGGVSALAG